MFKKTNQRWEYNIQNEIKLSNGKLDIAVEKY
jgi:hypothetical protein